MSNTEIKIEAVNSEYKREVIKLSMKKGPEAVITTGAERIIEEGSVMYKEHDMNSILQNEIYQLLNICNLN